MARTKALTLHVIDRRSIGAANLAARMGAIPASAIDANVLMRGRLKLKDADPRTVAGRFLTRARRSADAGVREDAMAATPSGIADLLALLPDGKYLSAPMGNGSFLVVARGLASAKVDAMRRTANERNERAAAARMALPAPAGPVLAPVDPDANRKAIESANAKRKAKKAAKAA